MNRVFELRHWYWTAVVILVLLAAPTVSRSDERAVLPSWNDGSTKQSIIDFITRVTKEGGADFIPVAERIATFDNDGTLWCEQPMYIQAEFSFARVRQLAASHPEWRQQQPYKMILENNSEGMAKLNSREVFDLVMASHSGTTTDEFPGIVRDWFGTSQHPRFHRPYMQVVYQPMLELLAYMRANQFKTYIVSGGGTDFMRAFAEKVYGVPPEQVIGTTLKSKFEFRDGKPVIVRLAEVEQIDDKDGKPVSINRYIGRRPVAAFGNSDGDLEMLQWTTAGSGARFGLIVHHTDAEREYAYDRKSPIGRLDKALDEAIAKKWTVVDMKQDWKTIFPEPSSK